MKSSLSAPRTFNRQTILNFIDGIKYCQKNIILIGSVGVGKTTFLNRIWDSKFETSDGGYIAVGDFTAGTIDFGNNTFEEQTSLKVTYVCYNIL